MKFFFSTLLLFTLLACTEELAVEPPQPEIVEKNPCELNSYTHFSDFEFYLKKHLSISMNTDDTIFVVPLGSCSSCVAKTLDALIMNRYNGLVVTGGSYSDYSQFDDRIALLDSTQLRNDSAYFMYQYDLEVVSPTMIIKDASKTFRISQLTYENWDCVAEKLNWKLPKEAYEEH